MTTTTTGLDLLADLLESVPGLPEVYATASGHSLGVQVTADCDDEQMRMAAVDRLLSVLGASPASFGSPYRDSPGRRAYEGGGWLGEFRVQVYTPVDVSAEQLVEAQGANSL